MACKFEVLFCYLLLTLRFFQWFGSSLCFGFLLKLSYYWGMGLRFSPLVATFEEWAFLRNLELLQVLITMLAQLGVSVAFDCCTILLLNWWDWRAAVEWGSLLELSLTPSSDCPWDFYWVMNLWWLASGICWTHGWCYYWWLGLLL